MFKKTLFIICLLCSVAFGEIQQITFDNVTNDNTLVTILRERLSFSGSTFTFPNGLTIDNATNNAFEWNENSEELIWTFATNAVNLSSSTGVVSMDYATIVPTANQMLFTPVGAIVGTVEGTVYYDSDTDKLFLRNASTLVDLTAGAGSPAGADTQMQYNDSGSFGAITTIIWDDTNLEFANDQSAAFGTEADWTVNFDDSVDDQLLWLTAATTADAITDPLFEIIVGTTPTADQEVFGVAKGTQASNTALLTLDEDGDMTIAGNFYQPAIASAASGNVNITINAAGTGTMTIGGISTGLISIPNANLDIGDAATDKLSVVAEVDTNLTLDDDTTDSPALILSDAGDNTATFIKKNGATANTEITIAANSDVEIVAGNLAVGDGSPGTAAMDGEDFYVNGDSEFDGTVQFDGAPTIDADATFNDQIAVNLNANDEEILITGTATTVTADNLIEAVMAAQSTSTYILALTQTPDADAQNDYIICADNTGSDAKFTMGDGGGTVWALDAAKVVQIDAATAISTSTTGVLNMDVTSATANNRAIYIDYEVDDGGSGTQAGIYIDVDDDGAGGDETFHGLSVLNSAGTNATVVGVNIANTVDTGLNVVAGAASVAVAIDAAATDHTGAAGVVDIEFDSITDNSEAVNIKATALTGGSGQSIAGMEIELVNDSSNGSDILYGLIINVTDSTATGTETGIYIKGTGIAAALQADFGYIRIGTGASPDVSPGDDDLFVEGTIEVDGAARFDGAITANSTITGDGGDAFGGFLKTVQDDSEPHAIAASESGTVLTNAGSNGADAWTLPSAAIGLEYIFVVMAAQEMRITPAGGDVINIDGTAADAAEYWTANAVGETLHLVAVDTTNWIAISFTGTWTQETP